MSPICDFCMEPDQPGEDRPLITTKSGKTHICERCVPVLAATFKFYRAGTLPKHLILQDGKKD